MKRVFALFLLIVLMVSLAACGGDQPVNTDSSVAGSSDASTDGASVGSSDKNTDEKDDGLVLYDPELEHKFIVADSDSQSIVVYDLNLCNGDFSKLEGDDAILWEWIWNNDPNSTHPIDSRWGLDSAKFRYSPYYGKDVVIACASSGWVGVIDYQAKAVLWEDDLSRGPHSVEMLPNGDLIVAVATDGASRLVYYSLSAGITEPVHQVEADLPHGVSWDPVNECIWSLEYKGVVRINIKNMGKEDAKIIRVSGTTGTFAGNKSGGHAFAPIGGQPGKYWASNNADLQIFDAETGKLTNSYSRYKTLTGKEIKGVCSYVDGTVIELLVEIGGDSGGYVSNGFRIITLEKGEGKVPSAKDKVEIIDVPDRGFYKIQEFTKNYQ